MSILSILPPVALVFWVPRGRPLQRTKICTVLLLWVCEQMVSEASLIVARIYFKFNRVGCDDDDHHVQMDHRW